MKWGIGRILMLTFLICVLVLLGTCYFQNCREDTGPELPTTARYEVIQTTTGNTYPTKVQPRIDYRGNGEKVVTMYGYWQFEDGKYIYHDVTLPLDEHIFGKIKVREIQ